MSVAKIIMWFTLRLGVEILVRRDVLERDRELAAALSLRFGFRRQAQQRVVRSVRRALGGVRLGVARGRCGGAGSQRAGRRLVGHVATENHRATFHPSQWSVLRPPARPPSRRGRPFIHHTCAIVALMPQAGRTRRDPRKTPAFGDAHRAPEPRRCTPKSCDN